MGDRVGVELLFNSVEFGVPKQLPGEFQTVETRCGREGHTRPRGASEPPNGVDPNIRTRKTQRDGHNREVKIWSLCSVSSPLSHANLQQPFRTLAVKWEVNICKEVFPMSSFLRLYLASFLPAFSFLHLNCYCVHPLFVRLSFIMHLLSLRRYVSSIYICMQQFIIHYIYWI